MSNYKVGNKLIIKKKSTRNHAFFVGDVVEVIKNDESSVPYYVRAISGMSPDGYTGWVDESEVGPYKAKSEITKTPETMKTAFILKDGSDLTVFETREELMEEIDGNDCDNYEVLEVTVTKSFKVDDTPRLIEVKPVKPVKVAKKTAKRA